MGVVAAIEIAFFGQIGPTQPYAATEVQMLAICF
jgi:hypothetical protein